MNISYLEISALNLGAFSIATKIAMFGFVYHDVTVMTVGGLGAAYAVFRAGHALKIWLQSPKVSQQN